MTANHVAKCLIDAELEDEKALTGMESSLSITRGAFRERIVAMAISNPLRTACLGNIFLCENSAIQ